VCTDLGLTYNDHVGTTFFSCSGITFEWVATVQVCCC
jgi:hypothetical protein